MKSQGLTQAGILVLALLASGCVSSLQNVSAQASDAPAASEQVVQASPIALPSIADSFTRGGEGGEVIAVTTIASDGPGSLREALAKTGPRTIVFEVGGVIDLEGRNLAIDHPFVTVAGQTAPSPGINIVKGGLVIRSHDVIVQHVRIRPGDLGEAPRSGRDIDAITTIAAHNVVVDHCTLSWATDENLSASGPRFTGETEDEWRAGTSHNILYSNNIIAEGLANSTHAKGEHSKGSLIHDNVSRILLYRNIYASNFERSPLFKGGVRGAIINNYIYNPGQRAIHYNLQGLEWDGVDPVEGQMDVIGNVMKAGPSTHVGLPLIMIAGIGDLSLFLRDNHAIDRWGEPVPVLGHYTTNDTKFLPRTAAHFDWAGLSIASTGRLEAELLATAGARPWDRDGHDVRVLADLAEGRGEIIDSQSQVGGYPDLEASRQDFMPDLWDLRTMLPKDTATLDNRSSARGT